MGERKEPRSNVSFEVYADKKWQKTGITVTEQEQAEVTYVSGSWNISPAVRNCDSDGNSRYIAKEGYTMPGKAEGGMIGRIGSSVFWIGKKGETPKGLKGELELCANDDLDGRYGKGFTDNSGSIVVKIDLFLS